MATYENPHTLPPVQCSSNTTTFTDPVITANDTKIRAVHITELRTVINDELTRRGFAQQSWTDTTLSPNVTKIRKVHMEQMRTEVSRCKIGDCSADSNYCPEDTTGAVTWSNPDIVENSTQLREVHITAMRTYITDLMASCICESEQCNYCADCGYYYTYCDNNGVACANSQSKGGCGKTVYVYSCASINLAAGTAFPHRSATSHSNYNPWNNTVPWVMGTADRPAAAWKNWNYYPVLAAPAVQHTEWNCKCNPFVWRAP